MPKLKINGHEIEVPSGATVLQACEEAGEEIPRFCYHNRLSIAGNCRMCLVDLENAPKPIASCAMPAADGMEIHTNTASVKKAREGVMEFLLINHPLDCPICDQGGECDLQDQAVAYGRHFSRFGEGKRSVHDKDIGPLVGTIMTRCIHCTRCIRFSEEIAGVEEMGAVYRGEHMEIGTYIEKAMHSELSGNLIDLCPVGALTSKPYAFTARPWELKKTETIDAMDAVGSNIRIDARGREIMRVLPRLNEDVNEEWISDKSRFSCDGLKYKRLDRPWIREDGCLKPASWQQAFSAIHQSLETLEGNQIASISGDMVDCESVFALKQLMSYLGSQNIDCRQDLSIYNTRLRASYIFNSGISSIEDSDCILLVGTNPRFEAPIINARIRKSWLQGDIPIGLIGQKRDLTYQYDHLGDNADILSQIVKESHPFFEKLKQAKRPMIILGQAALSRPDSEGVIYQSRILAQKTDMITGQWFGFNILQTAAGRVGALDIGFVPGPEGRDTRGILESASSGEIKFVYLLGADELEVSRLENSFIVYQGHHGDRGAAVADVILPGAAYTEKDATWVNTEGRVQRATAAVQPPGQAREDWAIIRALSEVVGHSLSYDTLPDLRSLMIKEFPVLAGIDKQTPGEWGEFGEDKPIDQKPFGESVSNFYMTDPISRCSPTMAECIKAFSVDIDGKINTNG
tara:strand:- start:11080 stop:13143 length:2064 start_codon:yes stop_codon:yes gene_type:complete